MRLLLEYLSLALSLSLSLPSYSLHGSCVAHGAWLSSLPWDITYGVVSRPLWTQPRSEVVGRDAPSKSLSSRTRCYRCRS